MLPEYFFQVNRFEVINLEQISLIDHAEKEVHLKNGKSCSIGSNYYQQLCELLD
jgi:DNA-binding LytR/AlgR family response regulator